MRLLSSSSALARSLLGMTAGLALGCQSTLPAAPPHARVAPSTSPPVTACWLELATDEQPGDLGLAGNSDFAHWHVTYSTLLVRHAGSVRVGGGDLLVDSGISTHFAEEIQTASFLPRQLLRTVIGGAHIVATLPEALRAAGEDRALLRGIVVSHAHADHAGGVVDLPGVPVLLAPEELAFVKAQATAGGFDVVRAEAEAIEARGQPVAFTDKPYETFDRSYDVYGDGSVVLVPLFGHTPGSIGTFVHAGGLHLFHVGDAADTFEAIAKRRGKAFPLTITDHDGELADVTLAKIAQLHELDPSLVILPAHDRSSWLGLFGAPGRCYPPGAASR